MQSASRFRVEKWLWIIFTPVALITGLVNQVSVVSLLSIYALVLSAASAEQAAEAKEMADHAEQTAEDENEGKAVTGGVVIRKER